jgi:predicted RNA-binding Zn-ribbon protein involved in translation (DUF1610 family)
MTEKIVCSSCKKDVTNILGNVTLPCPKCGKTKLIRCRHCREISAKYKCHECGFTGPN